MLLYVPMFLLFPLILLYSWCFKCHSFIIIFLSKEFSFSQYLMVSLLVKISFSFLLPGNDFIFSSFLKDSFTWYRIYCWPFFSFRTWNMLCHFGSLCFQIRNTLWNWCLPLSNMSFFSGYFWDSSLSLSFKSLIIMCPGIFLWFSCLWFIHLLRSVGLCLLPNYNFLAVISSNTLSASISPILLRHWLYKRWNILLSRRSLRLCFLSVYFLSVV